MKSNLTAIEWLQSIEMERDLNLGDWRQAKVMHKEEMIIFAIWFNNTNNEYLSYENIVDKYYKETYEL